MNMLASFPAASAARVLAPVDVDRGGCGCNGGAKKPADAIGAPAGAGNGVCWPPPREVVGSAVVQGVVTALLVYLILDAMGGR